MEGNGADGQPEHPKPGQSYVRQHEADRAAHRGGPARTPGAGEPSTRRRRGGQPPRAHRTKTHGRQQTLRQTANKNNR